MIPPVWVWGISKDNFLSRPIHLMACLSDGRGGLCNCLLETANLSWGIRFVETGALITKLLIIGGTGNSIGRGKASYDRDSPGERWLQVERVEKTADLSSVGQAEDGPTNICVCVCMYVSGIYHRYTVIKIYKKICVHMRAWVVHVTMVMITTRLWLEW